MAKEVTTVVNDIEILEGWNVNDWKWNDEMEGINIAPNSHKLLFRNATFDVVLVEIEPGITEPEHVHYEHSLFIILQPTKIDLTFMQRDSKYSTVTIDNGPNIQWMGCEPPHYVKNHDEEKYWRAIRVFLHDVMNPWQIQEYHYKKILKWKQVNWFVHQVQKTDQTQRFHAMPYPKSKL